MKNYQHAAWIHSSDGSDDGMAISRTVDKERAEEASADNINVAVSREPFLNLVRLLARQAARELLEQQKAS